MFGPSIDDSADELMTNSNGGGPMPGLTERFEELVAKIFEAEGFTVTRGDTPSYDLSLRSQTGQTAVVEVRLSRSRTIPFRLAMTVVERLETARRRAGRDRSVIVFGCQLIQSTPEMITKDFPSVTVYDYARLAFIAAKHPQLAAELENIIQKVVVLSDGLTAIAPAWASLAELDTPPPVESEWTEEDYKVMPKGAELCQRLHATGEGREGYKAFESAASNALRYLFDDELAGWSEQHRSEEGMSIYDLVARVTPATDFWRIAVESFRSRYVVFEFKNYKDAIGQGEIYTTERYLFATALRNLAIIIARNGASESALRAAKGALKEHGKLIMVLSAQDICDMLNMRDVGNTPSDSLLSQLDDMLTRLER
jgi:hypothetical protein